MAWKIQSSFIPIIDFKKRVTKWILLRPKQKKEYIGKRGGTFTSEFSPNEIDLDIYDAVIVPGGQAPDKMRIHPGMVEIIKAANAKGKIIAAICHGPQMLIEADIVRGKIVTSWLSVRTDLKNAGAKVVDESSVVDGNIVTSRSPDDLPDFCKATLNQLATAE